MLENHFPNILEGLMNHDHQRYASVYNQGQFIQASSNKLNINFRCGVRDGGQTQRAPSSRFPQPKIRSQAQCHGSFYDNTPEIPYNHHHNGQITNPTYYTAHSSKDTSHTSIVRPTNANHTITMVFLKGESVQSECSIDSNFPCDNHHQCVHNPSIAFDCSRNSTQ